MISPHIVCLELPPSFVFVSVPHEQRTGKIKQQEVCDRASLFGAQFDVSSHSLYGCFFSCFCFETV